MENKDSRVLSLNFKLHLTLAWSWSPICTQLYFFQEMLTSFGSYALWTESQTWTSCLGWPLMSTAPIRMRLIGFLQFCTSVAQDETDQVVAILYFCGHKRSLPCIPTENNKVGFHQEIVEVRKLDPYKCLENVYDSSPIADVKAFLKWRVSSWMRIHQWPFI